jgi:1-acyl-sn-glycerol-3-phosphate acyltransferase
MLTPGVNKYFPHDSYDTPEDTPRHLLDRMLLGSRWYLYAAFVVGTVLTSRALAARDAYTDEAWAESSYRVFKLIEGCSGRFHLRGLDNLKKLREPVVIVSNHMSTLETLVFPCLIAPVREVTYVVKESLMRGPVFGPIMRSREPITVGRKNPRDDLHAVLDRGSELLAKGKSIIIFPESTRHQHFNPDNFNSLGIKLAKRAGVPCIPAAIKTDFWGNGALLRGFGPLDRSQTIHMAFGEPLRVKGRGREEHRAVVEFIQSHQRLWMRT